MRRIMLHLLSAVDRFRIGRQTDVLTSVTDRLTLLDASVIVS
jgi:hypothetical protein